MHPLPIKYDHIYCIDYIAEAEKIQRLISGLSVGGMRSPVSYFEMSACPMPVFICGPICSAEMNPFLNPAASPAGLTFFSRDAIMTPISKAYGE